MNSSRVFGFMRHISISVASLKTTYAGTLCRMARLFRSSLKAASSFSFHYDDSCRPKTVRNRIKRKRQIHLLTAAVLTVIIGAVVLAIIL